MSVIVDIDLRSLIGQVRDQGLRPTCLAFATTAAHEASRRSVDYLSVEHLFYRGVQRSHKNPMRGLNQVSVAEALGHDGQPIEAEWPYSEVVPDPATWTPPTSTGATHKATMVFSSSTVGDVRGMIESGVPVVLITSLTMAMYSPDEDGVVRSEVTDVVTARRHALLGVGSGHVEGVGGHILVRNSWGAAWGDRGHGWVPEPYLSAHLQDTGVVTSKGPIV